MTMPKGYKRSGPNCQEYYEEQVEPLIEEYRNREKKKRREFFGWQIAILSISSGIAIDNVVPIPDPDPNTTPWIRVVSTIFSAAVTVMTGLTQLLRAQQLWVLFGLTYVRLDSEWRQYQQHAGTYSAPAWTDEKRCHLPALLF